MRKFGAYLANGNKSAPSSSLADSAASDKLSSLSGPSRTFVFDRELSYRVSDYTKKSRFVLYDNGAFVLQFPSLGEGGYRGGYQDANGVITVRVGRLERGGPWGATGTLKGDSLTVQYNQIMQMTDFEDAVYVLIP